VHVTAYSPLIFATVVNYYLFAIVLSQWIYRYEYNNTSHSVTLKPVRGKARTGPSVLVLATLGFRRACFKFYRIFLELLATTLDEQLSIQSYISAETTQYGSR
jgi:hypothetical protein